jgi:aldehyde dehydrogenase (NAD+)
MSAYGVVAGLNKKAARLTRGAPLPRNQWMVDMAISAFSDMITTLEGFDFTRQVGKATVEMAPLGVAGLITPWNSDAFFICNKLATALAAGCTTVIMPSEMSVTQTHVVTQALHEAGLPKGLFNIDVRAAQAPMRHVGSGCPDAL